MNIPHPALVALTEGGAVLARRLALALPGARVHGRAGRVAVADIAFAETTEHLRALFAAGTPIVGFCAAGILVRALAPLLADKGDEPPVLAVAEDGSAIVPLLGGHRGGNALARRIAAITGVAAAITTASDVAHGVALDEPPPGWTLATPARVKDAAAALLAGRGAQVTVEAGTAGWLDGLPRAAKEATEAVRILVTDRADAGGYGALVYHSPVLALGIGCERGAEPDAACEQALAALADAGLSPHAVAVVVSLDLKEDEPAVHAVAAALGVPARFFDAARLEVERPRLAKPSDIVFRAVGAHGVAEAAALAAAGPKGTLVVTKQVGRRVTCAIARGPELDAEATGRPRGSLAVVGLGPGDARYRTPAADAALAAATDIVGYAGYIALLGASFVAGKALHPFALGEEEARCRHALALAATGRAVALLASGDPGVYALATLTLELATDSGEPAWGRIALTVEPGVSAMQLAAARSGAPLGHDFCAISLSDLLTPWPAIERRLRAAAEADFVVALYNPASGVRRRGLAMARDILLAARGPEVPVVVAHNLARDGEAVRVVALGALDLDAVDMMTVLIVGATSTRQAGGRVWTPRGYPLGNDAPRRAEGGF
ncbi:MAG: precorrin-3B C(17)-methyltransferase [Alphaproteobacteria bacterium]|nr:precorrin-3B C(17)-methyltransferase [Alphaproteobacteria bacterium]